MIFRIRRLFDDFPIENKNAIEQVKTILRSTFSSVPEDEIGNIEEQLSNPLSHRLRYFIHVAEDHTRRVKGFSILAHAPDLKFCYLDYISTDPALTSSGIGGAIYGTLRDECRALGVIGIFMECLPDDEQLCPGMLKENSARLKFYERYGARPVINTEYETPLKPEDICPPYLVFDDLGQGKPLKKRAARNIVRAILERKYGNRCPAGYVERVVNSFNDEPVALRPPQYIKKPTLFSEKEYVGGPIAMVVNDQHLIHHVHERGYVESPVRISAILTQLETTDLFTRLKTIHFSIDRIKAVHDSQFINYLSKVCTMLPAGKSVYPYVFPIRNSTRPPKELPVRAGYYCIDTFTPLNKNAFLAARGAADCALTAAKSILDGGYDLAYALVRPPGHHAERRSFGGFCYFNSTAAAAQYLSHFGRVAVLDIDYHHGNGTQDIFYARSDVLTLSIHGHPRFAYPYFSGFSEEIGEGSGLGFNHNLPLPENGITGAKYLQSLKKCLLRIKKFHPRFLIIALGLDTAKGDPTGTWSLINKDFYENGRHIGRLGLSTLVVQEGGYKIRSLGSNARHFFQGLTQGNFEAVEMESKDLNSRIRQKTSRIAP